MNPLRIFYLILLQLAAIPFGQSAQPEPMRGVNRGKAQPAAAVLLVGINETAGSVAEPGWPLIVAALRQPDSQMATVPLPANLRVKMTDASGREIAMAFEPVSRPATEADQLFWLAAEAGTARLSPGTYQVTLEGQLTGWRVESGIFQIVTPSADRIRLGSNLKIQRSALLGRHDEALGEADRLLAANDKDKEAWIAKGDIYMLKDLPDEAVQAFDRALSLHKKTDREPIAITARRRAAFLRSLEKRGVVPAQRQQP